MGGQRVQSLVGRKASWKIVCNVTSAIGASARLASEHHRDVAQYHANYPRCKQLVQSLFSVPAGKFSALTRTESDSV